MHRLTIPTPICPVVIDHDGTAVTRTRLLGMDAQVESEPSTKNPAWVKKLAVQIGKHMAGEPQDFADVPVDLSSVGDFARTVYDELRRVPAGQTVSYGELARRVGRPTGARAVARAMAANPIPLFVPCHRVMGASGTLTGFSGADGITTKARLLFAEGIVPRLSPDNAIRGSIYTPDIFALAVAALRQDPLFEELHHRIGHFRPERNFADNPFASLVQAVCYQQLAGNAAAAIFRRVREALGGDPTPDAVRRAGDGGLRSAGLSGTKAATILALADAVDDGLVLEELSRRSYDEVLDRLTAIRGIGPWTVEMFAIFHLGLPDIFSPGDLGIRKAVTLLEGRTTLVSPAHALMAANRWRPFRTIATLALWRRQGLEP
jgi:O-6-methylguanine DNA methyltransferase